MKKAAVVLGIIVVVFALAQCSLFSSEIKYLVTSGDADEFQILYQSGGDMTEVTSNRYWVYTFDVLNGDKPQLAFICVSKSLGACFTVEIQKDGVTVATDAQPSGSLIELYSVIK